MTQDRRITDKLPEEPLVFTDRNLTAAGLAHLEAERASACLVHAGGEVWVGVGTKDALRGLLSKDTASQSQAVPSELASLTRYGLTMHEEGFDHLVQREEGSWVKFSDVQSLFSHSAATGKVLNAEDVEWVVNDNAELGVKVGNQFFFLYKGYSLVYETGCHENGEPMMYRRVFKREFGECAHPINYEDFSKIGIVSLSDSDEWKPIAASPAAPLAGKAEEPKDTPESMANSNARFAIDGAIMFGREGVNKPPSEDHWLYEYWSIGRQLAKLGETSGWDNISPVSAPLAAAVPEDANLIDLARLFGSAAANGGQVTLPASACAKLFDSMTQVAALPAEEASDVQRDAARYRWLRNPDPQPHRELDVLDDDHNIIEGRALDAAIDAKMGAVAPAEPAPILASALTDERIKCLWREATEGNHGDATVEYVNWFARAIKREVLARLSKPTAQGTAPSIDTQEFINLLMAWHEAELGDESGNAYDNIVDFINRHIAAQAPAGRDAVLEEAAKVCDLKYETRAVQGLPREASAARNCAEEIRALKSHAAEQTTGGEHA